MRKTLDIAYCMSIQPNASLTKIGLAAPVSTIVGIILNIGYYIRCKMTSASVDGE